MRLPPLVDPVADLTRAEVERYARHLVLPGLGLDGQRRLRSARVCVVGAGGLGSPVLQYLAAAGVGVLGVVDDDLVAASNLQRQVLHASGDVGRLKVDSAAEAVLRLGPGVEVVRHPVRLTAATVDLLGDYDLVVDGSDNFETRYLVNDACVRLGLPEVWGSVLRFDAQVAVFWGHPPTGVPAVQLRDLFPEPPAPGDVPSCVEAGVLGALCGQVGTVMATEAIKLIAGLGNPLLGRVLVLDALEQRWTEIPLGEAPQAGDLSLADRQLSTPPVPPEVTAAELRTALVGPRPPVLLDIREPAERATAPWPGAVALALTDALAGEVPPEAVHAGQLVVVCRAGVRSAAVAGALRSAGYDAVHLAGGMLAWEQSGSARGSVR